MRLFSRKKEGDSSAVLEARRIISSAEEYTDIKFRVYYGDIRVLSEVIERWLQMFPSKPESSDEILFGKFTKAMTALADSNGNIEVAMNREDVLNYWRLEFALGLTGFKTTPEIDVARARFTDAFIYAGGKLFRDRKGTVG